MRTITTLDELYDVLRAAPQDRNDGAEIEYATRYGLPTAHGRIDWTSLPTFGGPEPRDTVGVWSWDQTRLLVGTCADDLRIVDREA